jgi:hypothetical protein
MHEASFERLVASAGSLGIPSDDGVHHSIAFLRPERMAGEQAGLVDDQQG